MTVAGKRHDWAKRKTVSIDNIILPYLWSVSSLRMSSYNESAVIFLMSTFKPIPSRGPTSYNDATAKHALIRLYSYDIYAKTCSLFQ